MQIKWMKNSKEGVKERMRTMNFHDKENEKTGKNTQK